MNTIRKSILVFLLCGSATLPTLAQNSYWTGQGTSLNWNDAANWDAGVPAASTIVWFEDLLFTTGYTNAAGAVNNVVTGDPVAAAANYVANSFGNFSGTTNRFYTTLVPNGASLTLGGYGASYPALSVGDVPTVQWLNAGSWTNYTTITGAGSLVVNDGASLISVGQRNRATLDLSGMNTFTGTARQILVGATADNPTATAIAGGLLLGKTNALTTSANLSAPGIIAGSFNLANSTGLLLLGGTNTINTDGLVVGGRRATGTLLAFAPAYSNTVTAGNLRLRGSAGGTSRVGNLSIGDMAAQPTDYQGSPAGSSTGNADFSGGNVDILVDKIYVGRSAADTGTGGAFANGFGTLIVERGTVDVNNLYIAYKQGTNASSSLNGSSTALPCPVTIKSNAQMTVNGDVVMAFRNNGTNGSQIPYGALIVNDSATVNIGGKVTTPTNGISLLQLGGGTVNMTGNGNVTNTALMGFGSITGGNNISVASNLVVGPVSSAGTLNLGGNLVLANPFPLTFNLGPDNTTGAGVNDLLNVTGDVNFNNNPVFFTFGGPLLAGSNYTVVSFTGSRNGSLLYTNDTRSDLGLDQTTLGVVSLWVTNWNPATLTWQGNAATNVNFWNTGTNLYWTNNASGLADKFYQGDAVVFNDTALQPIVYPQGLLFPASIVVDCNTKHIMITNRSQVTSVGGVIGGNCSITKNGPGTLTFGTYSNSFTGPINVNNGVWRLFDPNFSSPPNMPTLGSTAGTMYVNNGATLDCFGVSGTSSGKPVVIAGNGFNSMGVMTNGSTSGAVNGFAVTLAADSMVSADTGALGLRSTSSASTAPAFSGYLNLNGYTLTKLGGKAFTLQDVVATNTGSMNVATGNLAFANCIIDGPGSLNFSNNTYLVFGTTLASSTIGNLAKPINFYTAGLVAPASGNVAAPAVISSTVNLLGTLSVTNTQPIALNGAVSGNFGILKYGASNLLFGAANTYSGATVITAGGLAFASGGSAANTPVIQMSPGTLLDVSAKAGTFALASGQTLDLGANATVVGDLTVAAGSTLLGAGTINGSLTVNSNAEVALLNTNVTGTLIVSNNLNLAGGHFTWELAPSFDISDAFVVNGDLNLTGTNVFTVNSIGGFDPSGINTLITYTGSLTGGSNNIIVNSSARFQIALVDPATTPGKIQIQLITPSPNLVWKGGASSNPTRWDVKTTANWDNGGSPDVFWSSDLVTFDDTCVTNVVNLLGTLGPASITFNNNNTNYFLGGSGGLVAASLTNNGSASVTISNTANTFFTGDGLVLNSGAVTFSQPTNVSLVANLVGPGTFVKAGSSNLLLTGSAANFSGTINVNGGQLRAGSTNAVASTVNVASGATLDVNGQLLTAAVVTANGAGADGFGALNNRGLGRTNSLANVTLGGNTTFGALSNAWGINGTLSGGDFLLTKTNANDVWIQTGSDTGLGDIEVRQGRLVFARDGTTLGNAAKEIIVRTGATLALAATNQMNQTGPGTPGIAAGTKTLTMLSGATFESIGFPVNSTTVNSFDGPIAINTNAVFKVGGNSRLVLTGPISGNSQLIVTNGGTLYLGGTNTYASNTFVFSGTLVLTNSQSLPTNGVLAISNNIATFGNASLVFDNNPVFPVTNLMRLSSQNGQVSVGGNGMWNGPILMHGSNGVSFSGGTDLLDLAGTLVTTNVGGAVAFHGSNTRVRGALTVPNATVSIGVGDGLGAGFDERFTTVTFDNSNIWSGTTTIDRGRVNLGTNNVLPPSVPIRVGTLAAGVSDRRIIFDLGGYNQTISSLTETFVGDSRVLVGNSSTNSNSVLTYAGTGTNTWGAIISDILDTPDVPHTTALTVTSGILNLVGTNTYTGPTTVTGGRLNLIQGSGLTAGWVGQIGNSSVTVSGTGTLGGNGMVLGSIIVGSGGTLSPGTSIGVLTVSGELQLTAGGKCEFEVNLGTGLNDQVVGLGSVTYGGTLIITNVGAQAITNGTILKLFDAASYTAGVVVVQPSPGFGLRWDTSFLAVDGTLRVAPVSTTPIPITATVSGGGTSLDLSWPADHIGWLLQAQTNSLSVGISTNWFGIASSTITNQVQVPIVPGNPAVFFRLVHP